MKRLSKNKAIEREMAEFKKMAEEISNKKDLISLFMGCIALMVKVAQIRIIIATPEKSKKARRGGLILGPGGEVVKK